MKRPNHLDRRRFLMGVGGITLGLPMLNAFAETCSVKAAAGEPQRYILMHNSQGTVLNAWNPIGTESSFALSEILQPLVNHKEKLLIIGGCDNISANGHFGGTICGYTGADFLDPSAPGESLAASGPSIDQLLATRIQGTAAVHSLNMAIGSGTGGKYYTSRNFWRSAGDPVSSVADPLDTYFKLFAGGDADPKVLETQLARRKSVLDAVLDNFNHLRSRVGKVDRAMLDAHAQKVFELEKKLTLLTQAKKACTGIPMPVLPEGYDFRLHAFEPQSADLQMDLMVYAMGCGLTRVGTLLFPLAHSPTFPWLEAEWGGPLWDVNQYDVWHTMVHSGRDIDGNGTAEPGLRRGYTHYAEMFALLLDKLAAYPDCDGKSMLDTSLVHWGTEFGDGHGHSTMAVPVVLAGTVGGTKGMGRWLDYNSTGTYVASAHSLNEVYVAILHAFGFDDPTFGDHKDFPTGPLPGVL